MIKTSPFSVTRRRFLKNLTTTGMLVGSTHFAHTSPFSRSEIEPVTFGSSDWPRFGCDLRNSRFNSKENQLGKENVGQLDVKWKFETDAPIQTTPTVIGNTLYFGTLAGYQYALDSTTGTQKWKHFIGYSDHPGAPTQGIRSSCQFDNGRIYFGTGLAKVHCLDAHSGKEIWQTQIGSKVTFILILPIPMVTKHQRMLLLLLGKYTGLSRSVRLQPHREHAALPQQSLYEIR